MKKKGFFFMFVFNLFLGFMFSAVLNASELTIYTEDEPPFQFVDKNGKLTGYTVELVREIQKRVGTDYPIKMVPWARGYDAIQREPNVVLFSMSRTAERNPLFQWVGPIMESIYAFYAKADSDITVSSLEEAKKVKSIGVYLNDVRDIFLTQAGFKNLDKTIDPTVNYKKLMAGRLTLLADSPSTLEAEAREAGFSPKDFKLVYIFFSSQSYIAFSKDTSPEIVKAWNNALKSMKKDGTFKIIFKKYFPDLNLSEAVMIY